MEKTSGLFLFDNGTFLSCGGKIREIVDGKEKKPT